MWEFFRARDAEGRSRVHLDRVAPAPPSPMGERLEVACHRERVEDASFWGTDREFLTTRAVPHSTFVAAP